jgi:hypothetical protein
MKVGWSNSDRRIRGSVEANGAALELVTQGADHSARGQTLPSQEAQVGPNLNTLPGDGSAGLDDGSAPFVAEIRNDASSAPP